MTDNGVHEPGCGLDPVHFLDHAVGALERLASGSKEEAENADRLSAASLLNGLNHFIGQPGWRTVTLLDLALFATLMDEEKFPFLCRCRRGEPDKHSQEW